MAIACPFEWKHLTTPHIAKGCLQATSLCLLRTFVLQTGAHRTELFTPLSPLRGVPLNGVGRRSECRFIVGYVAAGHMRLVRTYRTHRPQRSCSRRHRSHEVRSAYCAFCLCTCKCQSRVGRQIRQLHVSTSLFVNSSDLRSLITSRTAADFDKWSWSSQVGTYQTYIYVSTSICNEPRHQYL